MEFSTTRSSGLCDDLGRKSVGHPETSQQDSLDSIISYLESARQFIMYKSLCKEIVLHKPGLIRWLG